jgi:hypothetical protein
MIELVYARIGMLLFETQTFGHAHVLRSVSYFSLAGILTVTCCDGLHSPIVMLFLHYSGNSDAIFACS